MRIKFGSWAPNHHCENVGGFKFGDSVQDCHTYNIICKHKILAAFNLAVAKTDHQTAKFNLPPNFLAIQYYGAVLSSCYAIGNVPPYKQQCVHSHHSLKERLNLRYSRKCSSHTSTRRDSYSAVR